MRDKSLTHLYIISGIPNSRKLLAKVGICMKGTVAIEQLDCLTAKIVRAVGD